MVTYNSSDKKPITIELTNSVGVVVKRIHKNKNTVGLDKTEINVKYLFSGLYYVIFKAGNKIYTNKFLKIK